MKTLTANQKQAILDTITKYNSDAVNLKVTEAMKDLKLSEEQKMFLNKLNELNGINIQLSDIEKRREKLRDMLRDSKDCCYYNNLLYTQLSPEELESKFKEQTASVVVNSTVKLPDYSDIRRELELLTISSDFDIEKFIDKFKIK